VRLERSPRQPVAKPTVPVAAAALLGVERWRARVSARVHEMRELGDVVAAERERSEQREDRAPDHRAVACSRRASAYTEGAPTKNQIPINVSSVAHASEESGIQGQIGFP